MPHVVFIAPRFLENTNRYVKGFAALDDVTLSIVSEDPQEAIPAALRSRVAGHYRVNAFYDLAKASVLRLAFAQSEGEILGYDELIRRCWEGRIVGENAIHRAVSKVRDLGLKFGGGTFTIETINKVGYRMSVRWSDALPQPAIGIRYDHQAQPAVAQRGQRRGDVRLDVLP